MQLIPLEAESANSIRTVALSGAQAPGAERGAVFDVFEAPTLNNSGKTAFASYLVVGIGGIDSYNNRGVWSEGQGPLSLVAQGGQSAPGTPLGAVFRDFEDQILLSKSGDVAFVAKLRLGLGDVNSINQVGIWSQADGNLSLIARERDQAPGTPNGANFSTLGVHIQSSSPHVFSFGDSGQVAFGARISNNLAGEGGVTSSSGSGIWSQQAGMPSLFVRSGSQAPGTPDETLFQINSSDLPAINSVGQIAFASNLVGPGIDSTNSRGIWSNGHGPLELIARTGSQAPGFDSGKVFDRLFAPSINSDGDVAFVGWVPEIGAPPSSIGESGVWTNRDGPLALVARRGMQAPGAIEGVKYQGISNVVINDAGSVAFHARLDTLDGNTPPSIADNGIWAETNGKLELVARSGVGLLLPNDPIELGEGTPVPGYPDGTSFYGFDSFVLNNAGQVAFEASTYREGTPPGSSRGIWAQDRGGVLQLVVGEGSQIDVDNGPGIDLRTIDAIRFYGTSGNGDGRASAFNDFGQLAFAARFTDKTWGVFVSNVATVPEPSSLPLMAVGVLMFLLPPRRC